MKESCGLVRIAVCTFVLLFSCMGCATTTRTVGDMSDRDIGRINRINEQWANTVVKVDDTVLHADSFEIQADSIILFTRGVDSLAIREAILHHEIAYIEGLSKDEGVLRGAALGVPMAFVTLYLVSFNTGGDSAEPYLAGALAGALGFAMASGFKGVSKRFIVTKDASRN